MLIAVAAPSVAGVSTSNESDSVSEGRADVAFIVGIGDSPSSALRCGILKTRTAAFWSKAKKVTGLTNSEEGGVGLTNIVSFLIENELKAKGGDDPSGPDWGPYVVEDGILITGQNPASSTEAAKCLIQKLVRV